MKIQPGSTAQSEAPLRMVIYGDPKKGKTRLATSIPWGGRWGEKWAYVAWDAGSGELSSVLPYNRDHLLVVTPETKTMKDPKTKEDKLVFDPLEEAVKIARHDWRAEGCTGLIFDTLSVFSEQLLAAIASAQVLPVNRPYSPPTSLGTPGTDSFVAQPSEYDYGAAHRGVEHVLDFLDLQPLHLVLLFHGNEDDKQGKAEVVGGPSTVGRAQIRSIARRYDNLVRVAIDKVRIGKEVPAKYEYKRIVQTDSANGSYWLTGLRVGAKTNPMATFPLDEDPITFWIALEKVMRGEQP